MKRKIWIAVAAALHAVLMIAMTLFWLGQTDTLDDELILIQFTAYFRKFVLNDEIPPDRDRFLFVNVAWDKQFIPKNDKDGFPIGVQAVTDREKLGRLFQILNETEEPAHKLIVTDIFFKDSSANDSLIRAELPRLKNSLLSYHKTPEDKPDYPIFQSEYGLSDMESDRRMILKYKLIQGDSLKTTPLLMYEKLYGQKQEEGFLLDRLAGEPIMNSFILDYKIRPVNILDREKYNIVYLGELLMLPPPVVREMLKDRIVLLGDYEDRDLHYTVYGYMPGTIILLNAFLALENGDNQVSWGFIFFIFVGFALISVKAFVVRDPLTRMIERKLGSDSFAVELMLDMTFFLVFLGIMSLISYFVFNIHLAILFLSFYLYGLELVFDFIIQRKAKKKEIPAV